MPDEPAASHVRAAFEGIASGRFRSIIEVKRHFESETDAPRNEQGEMRIAFVTEVLRRSLFAGLMSIPKWNIRNAPAKHEPITRCATFTRVRELLDGRARAPARKDPNLDFLLRSFLDCSCYDKALTAGWSKNRSGKLKPSCLRHARGCVMRGKSLRREGMEGAF